MCAICEREAHDYSDSDNEPVGSPVRQQVHMPLDNSPLPLGVTELSAMIGKFRKKLNIGSLNVQGLANSYHELKQILQCELSLDILLLQETWIFEGEDLGKYGISGYKLLSNPRLSNIHGGTAAYIRSHLSPSINNDLTIQSDGIEFEQLVFTIRPRKNTSLTLISGYRPPDVRYATALSKLQSTIENLVAADANFVICGDININVKQHSASSERLEELISSFSLRQVVTSPTRITNMSSTLIDIAIVPGSCNVIQSHVANLGISDHCLICLVLDFIVPIPPPQYKFIRNYRGIDPPAFQHALRERDWGAVQGHLDSNNIDSAANALVDNIRTVLDEHAPIRKVKIKENSDPWFTRELLAWRSWKNQLYKAAIRSRNDEDWTEYVRIRNYYTSMLRKAKRDYFRSRFMEMERNGGKNYWPLIKQIKGSQRAESVIRPTKHWANELNAHFATVGESTFEEARTAVGEVPVEEVVRSIPWRDPAFEFVPPSVAEINKIISRLGNFKAGGEDGINGFVLKLSGSVVSPWLAKIAGTSFGLRKFPDPWKRAVVVPLPKDGDPSSPANYRPISLLSCCSKVLERAAFNQLNDYFESENIISDNQSGFRKGCSTETAMVRICSDLSDAMDAGKLSIVILLDLSKAFDCVPHDILLAKLERYGLCDSALEWVRSYLKGRTQKVKIGTIMSEVLPVNTGVPQGSVKGPFCFSIENNDLPNAVRHCKIDVFADDTQLRISFLPSESVETVRRVQEDLDSISEWMSRNGLKVNAKKTKALLIGSHQRQAKFVGPDLFLNGERLEFVPQAKNLGVIMDDKLTFGPHLTSVAKKAKVKLREIAKIRNCFSAKPLKLLVQSFVLNALLYCCSVYKGAAKSHLHKLQECQNFGAKIVCNLRKFDRASGAIQECGWKRMDELVLERVAMFALKAYKGALPEDLREVFHIRNQRAGLRGSHIPQFSIPRTSLTAGQRSFRMTGPSSLNEVLKKLEITDLDSLTPKLLKELL